MIDAPNLAKPQQSARFMNRQLDYHSEHGDLFGIAHPHRGNERLRTKEPAGTGDVVGSNTDFDTLVWHHSNLPLGEGTTGTSGNSLRDQEVPMSDDKSKVGRQDRERIAAGQDYEVEGFHQKHWHLTHRQAVDIVRKAKGDHTKADQLAEQRRL
jgi:hypothetical protein